MNQFTYSKAISGGDHNMNQMQPCAGRNCGSTNPNLHSAECFEDYEKATGMNQRKPPPPQSPCEMTQAERKMFRLGWLECEAAHGIKENT